MLKPGFVALMLAITVGWSCAKVASQAPRDAGSSDMGASSPEVAAPVPEVGHDALADLIPPLGGPDVGVTPPRPWGGQTIDPSVGGNTPTMFGGTAAPTTALKIVYPLDGSLHPVNILDVTVQWQGMGVGKAAYRLRFTNALGTLDVFTACAKQQCVYTMPQAAWRAMADANRDTDVTLTVSAAGNGMTVPTSAPIMIHFSAGAVAGGMYYWSTKQQGIYRLTLGQSKAAPFINTPGCHGCHSVSRDGSRISWLESVAENETVRIAPTTAVTNARQDLPGSPEMPALNADGSRLLVSDGPTLSVYDAATFTLLSTATPGGLADGEAMRFFEWSPDGKTIALSVGTAPGASPGNNLYFVTSGISLVPYNDGKFGPLQRLVPGDKEASYYPSWSPDGKWIVFSSSEATPASPPFLGTYDNLFGRLRLIAASGGRIYELGQASQTKGNVTSWPKFSPFSQLNGQLLFVGFSTKASYGYLLPGSEGSNSQLWLAAVDLRRLSTGDPSWAPIWLPFQDLDQSNHLPYWTEAIGCLGDADCGHDSLCKNGQCVPPIVIP
jgi:hypothetical protein